ncbi:MAG: SUMF1/EgtB/PvdO family nonheme iron enzyme [Candidatus Poribacteria bacterium]
MRIRLNNLVIIILLFSLIAISCSRTPSLDITSQPSDATILLDGKEIGKTPFKAKITKGEHKLSISKLGYMPVYRQISIKKSESIDVKLDKHTLEDMVKVPAGEFLMGSSDEEIKKVVRDLGGGELGPDVEWFAAERPQHKVYLDEFYIDKYEVTNEQYKKFIIATGRATPRHWEGGDYPKGMEKYPIVYVSWEDADAYTKWIGKRLPTEAEWEKAARGTDARIWPWGNDFDRTKCNVECWEGSGPKPVGSYPEGVSPYGAYDMAGNVWEWTDSFYEPYPGSKYVSPEFGKKLRVLRGGSWYHYDSLGPIGARCASRDRGTAQSVSYVAGFRCAIGAKEISASQ